MGMFTRVRDIVNSNVNAALDKAEDPEKLVRQMVREMEDTLVEIKSACAAAMASRKKHEREIDRADERVAHWTRRAQLAVDHGRDDLAREALRGKQRYESEREGLVGQIAQLADVVAQYKDDIVQIEGKLTTARERQRVLVQRHIRAQKSRGVQRTIRRLDSSEVLTRFDAFEDRLNRTEADAELTNYGRAAGFGVEAQFHELERDETIEQELAALKNGHSHEAKRAMPAVSA